MLKYIQRWGLLLILLSASVQSKAVSINAKSLINQVITAYRSLHSYKLATAYKIQDPDTGQLFSEDKSSFAFQAPNKMMIRDSKGIYTCNGAIEKTFLVSYNQYIIQKEPSNIKDIRVNAAFDGDTIIYFIAGILTHNSNAFPDSSQIRWTAESSGNAYHPSETLIALKGTKYPVKIQMAINPSNHLITSLTMGWDTDKVDAQKINTPIPAATFKLVPPTYSKYATYFHYPEAEEKKWTEWEKQQNLKLKEEYQADIKFNQQMIAKYVGHPEVNFTALTPSGKKVELSQYLGHVVVVDFWATWCGPCQELMPTIEKINSKLSSKGVVVLAVDSWDNQSWRDSFLKVHPQDQSDVLIDPAHRDELNSIAYKLYDVKGIPTTLIINPSGVVTNYFYGWHKPEVYYSALKKLGVDTSALH